MTHELYVRHLRVRSASRNKVALRLGLEQHLRQTQVVPATLPSSAIVIIRRLVAESAFAPGASARRAWSQNVGEQIETIARRAVRPLRGYVPHEAESVLFWDAVELLTCYTQDVLARRERWYWRDLFAGGPADPLGARLLAGWRGYPSAIPRLLVTLVPSQVRQVFEHLTPQDVSVIVRLVHEQFSLPDAVFAAQRADVMPESERAAREVPPWEQWLPPGTADSLPPSATYLLGLSYTLVRQPHYARSPEFASRAVRWLETTPASDDRAPVTTREAGAPADGSPGEARTVDPAAGADGVPGSTDIDRAKRDVDVARADSPTVPEPDDADAALPGTAPEGIETRLGGVFYLVNALEWLIPALLPGAAERVNRWELVAALAWDLLGAAAARHLDDPIWSMLRELAQLAPETLLGAALPDSVHFRVAPEWLAGWGMESLTCFVQRDGGRLRVWADDVGILLVDVPDRGEALETLIARFAAAGIALHPVQGAVPASMSLAPAPGNLFAPGLVWWAACVRPLLDFRLRAALPAPQTSWPERLTVPAVVQVTQTHVDVRLALDQIDMDVRRAGLDVDPGWAPAYGYIIYFHFD